MCTVQLIFALHLKNLPKILDLLFFHLYILLRVANNEHFTLLLQADPEVFSYCNFLCVNHLEYCFHLDLFSKTSSYLNVLGAEVGRGQCL